MRLISAVLPPAGQWTLQNDRSVIVNRTSPVLVGTVRHLEHSHLSHPSRPPFLSLSSFLFLTRAPSLLPSHLLLLLYSHLLVIITPPLPSPPVPPPGLLPSSPPVAPPSLHHLATPSGRVSFLSDADQMIRLQRTDLHSDMEWVYPHFLFFSI